MALLREVKYLKQREETDHPIPESAAAVYAQSEIYRKFVQNLDVVACLYNRCVCCVERCITLKHGETEMNIALLNYLLKELL